MSMHLKTPYQCMVEAKKRDMLSEFDREMKRRRAEEAYQRFMAKILAPLN